MVEPVLIIGVVLDPVIGPSDTKETNTVAQTQCTDSGVSELPFHRDLDIDRCDTGGEELSVGLIVLFTPGSEGPGEAAIKGGGRVYGFNATFIAKCDTWSDTKRKATIVAPV